MAGDTTTLTVRLELTRAEDAGDPHAFRTGPQDYILRWEGGAFEQARFVWDDALMEDLAAVREPGRDPELVRRIGARLQRFLDPTRFRDLAADINAAAIAGRPVRLDIVSGAAELYALPWELLTLRDGRHLGELPNLAIQYHWPGAAAVPPAREPRPEGGRILVAASSAFGNVGEAHTIAAIEAAAAAAFVPFARGADVLLDASLPGLVAWLGRRVAEPDPPAVLHILAHGAASGTGAYGLGLHDGRGGREVVDSGALRRALGPFAPQLRLVVLMACDSGNPGPLGALLGGAVQELHRAGFEAVLGSRYPLAGAAALAFTRDFYVALLEQTCSVEQAFLRARVGRARGADLDWASLTHYGHGGPGRECRPIVFRPHRGLLAFEREHARFFFGRDDERREAIADLEALIQAGKSRFLVVAGASGTGKSSVVLAGVLPDLEARGWACAVMRPGRAPMRALDEALALRPTDGRRCLLVVDQFEELFTHADVSGTEPSAFARRLWDLSQQADSYTQVILTLRVDYLGRCGEVVLDDAGLRLDRVAYDEAYRVFVAQMSPDKLAATIEGPVGRVGLTLEPGLARRLLDEIGSDPVGLPLLQYALDELWKRRADDALTHAALDAIGGVVGAITRHADAIVDALPPAEQHQARRLFVRLVAYGAEPSSGTRRRELEADLRPARDADAFARAVATLVDNRLLVRRLEPDGQATLEVAHEALIRHWSRLWAWYEQDRVDLARHRELAQIVAQAAQHKELLSGNRLAATETLVQSLGNDADPDAMDLVRRSRAAEDRSSRLTRLARLATLLSLLSVLVVVAVSRYNVARQAERAEEASARNKDSARLALAFVQLHERPHVAAALLREIEHTEIRQFRQAAYVATQSILPSSILRLESAAPSPVTSAALSPDADAVVTGHADGSVRLWPTRLEGHDPSVLVLRPGSTAPRRAIDELSVRRRDRGYAILAAGPTSLHLWHSDAGALTPVLAGDDLAQPDDAHFLGSSGLVARWHRGDAVSIVAPEAGALAPRRRFSDCDWLDPVTERIACRHDDRTVLFSWTSDAPLGPLTDAMPEPWPLGPEALLFHLPGAIPERDSAAIVDPRSMRILYYPERWQSVLGSRDLFYLNCDRDCVITRLPRVGGAASTSSHLPTTCSAPELLGAHHELGALVRCRGAQPWLIFVEPDPLSGLAIVRHDFPPPDNPSASFSLIAGRERLVALTRDAQLWQWDLAEPPAGWLPHVVRAHRSTLVHGTSAVLELDVFDDNTAELRHLRFERPGAAPNVDIETVALTGPQHYPVALAADATGYLAALASERSTSPRAPGTPPPVPPTGAVVWGEFPLTPPRVGSQPIGVEHFGDAPPPERIAFFGHTPRDPRALGAAPDLAPRALVSSAARDQLARQPGGPAAALPADDAVVLVDLHDLARGTRVAAPLLTSTSTDGSFESSDVLLAAAFHPGGKGLALAWEQGRAALVDVTSGRSVPAPAQAPSLCTEHDAALVTALAYSPDGRWLALGYASGRLELVPVAADGAPDSRTAALVLCRAHQPLRAIGFTPDGDAVVTGSAQGGLTIWTDIGRDAPQAEPIFEWLPGRPDIRDLSVSRDRILVLTASGHLWYSHTTFDLAALKGRVDRLAALCLRKADRQTLLLEDAATAEAAESACSKGHVLKERPAP